ncbi:MAG TPA: M23 family metallopeptidase, partial [Pyrinomonadaceae bacterium]|nr:M23 family metallopeptidase [Pyrinomonadaceae bacterium]
MPENTLTLRYEISNSVGRKSKGAVNKTADVETVQNMLRLAAMIESDPKLDPGGVDGTIDSNESTDDTIRAIEAFQSRFFKPDGVIGVGKRTWRELEDLLDGDDEVDEGEATPSVAATPVTAVRANGQCFFPFKEKDFPTQDWTQGMRCFGSRRSGGRRAHAGCDLYAPVGTTIHAISSGTVTLGPYAFYDGTYALEVDHGSFLARYGEIQKNAFVKAGDHVEAGQPIAKVGKLLSIRNSMLHLELYDKSATGPLTVKNNATKRNAKGVPF